MLPQLLTRLILIGFIFLLAAGCAEATPVAGPTASTLTSLPSTPSPSPTPNRFANPPTLTPRPPSPIPQPPSPTPLPTTGANPLGPWESLPTDGLPGSWVSDVAFATSQIVFVVVDGNVYRSDDGGETWKEVLNMLHYVESLAVSPTFVTDPIIFAVDGGSRLFRSSDGGETWDQLTRIAEVGGASDVEVWLSISPIFPTDHVLWATAGGEAYRSTDEGLTWEQFDPGFEITGEMRLTTNPNYPTDPTLEVADYSIPELWPLSEEVPYRPTLFARSEEILLLGTEHGLYRSADAGATWTEVNTGLRRSDVRPVAIAADGTIYALVNDPRLFRLQAGGKRWEPLGLLPQGNFGVLPVYDIEVKMDVAGSADAQPGLVIAASEGMFVSRDDGATWERIKGKGLPQAVLHRSLGSPLLLPLLAADFTESGVAYLIYYGSVYQTVDGGLSWKQAAKAAGGSKLTETPDRRLIAWAPNYTYELDPAVGLEWTRRPSPLVDAPTAVRFITDRLAAALVDKNVFLSQDGGRSWIDLGQIELDQTRSYLISPRFSADYTLYAQKDATIYVSTDAGRTWIEAGAGLPPCENYGSPECDLELFEAVSSGKGYTVYATVRHDFYTHIWMAHAGD